MPTSSSRLKTRPPISSVFPPHSAFPYAPRAISPFPPRPASASATLHKAPAPRLTYAQTAAQAAQPKLLRRAKRQRLYGDGTELDDIDDLPTDSVKESLYRVVPKPVEQRIPGGSYSLKASDKGTLRRRSKKEGFESSKPQTILSIKQASPSKTTGKHKKKIVDPSSPSQTKRKPTLIRNLGGTRAPKVVGDMQWNPQALRWEGNEHVLRDFETAVPARPALITHLTGSSVGSPVGSFAAGARIVGNMIFDPARMCWISTLAPEDDEPDVFADFADDEEDWEARGATIRASQQGSATVTEPSTEAPTRLQSPSPARGYRARAMSESESDRGSRASMVFDVDDLFLDDCRRAEERHRLEMKGWKSTPVGLPDRTSLFEIRALATRQY